MSLIEQSVKLVATLVAVWVVFWYLCYLVTGFHVCTVRVVNGLVLGGVSLTTSRLRIRVGSIKLKLFSGTKSVCIDGFDMSIIKVPNVRQSDSEIDSSIGDAPPPKSQLNPLNVYPRNRLAKCLLRIALLRTPQFDIEMRNSKFATADASLTCEYLRLHLDLRHSQRYNDTIKFNGQINANKLSASVCLNNHLGDEPRQFVVDTIKLQANWQVDLSTGHMYRVYLKAFVDRLQVQVFAVLKRVFAHRDEPSSERLHKRKKPHPQSLHIIERLQNYHRKLYSAIDEVSIHVENTELSGIPVIESFKDDSIKDYFLSHTTPNIAIDLHTKSVLVNYLRLNYKSPGFQVLFDSAHDTPFHVIMSMQLFRLNYSRLETDTLQQHKRQFHNKTEIFNIPQFGFTLKSNVLDHLARGQGFKNCVMELFTSASSPNLDLDTSQLTELVYNLVVIFKYTKLLRLRRKAKGQEENNTQSLEQKINVAVNEIDLDLQSDASELSPEDEHNIRMEARASALRSVSKSSNPIKKTLLKLLYDNYPRMEVKLTLEQPRVIVRHVDKNLGTIQLLNFLYSFLNVHLITTPEREYDIHCNILHPAVDYIEKPIELGPLKGKIVDTEIIGLKSVDFDVDILKNFKIKPRIKFDQLKVNLSELEALQGISVLLLEIALDIDNDLTKGSLNLRLNEDLSTEVQKRLVQKTTRNQNEDSRHFQQLPFWLLEVNLVITKILISFGSRSLFISPGELPEAVDENDFIGPHHQLRKTELSLENVAVVLTNQFERNGSKHDVPHSGGSFARGVCLWAIAATVLNIKLTILEGLKSNKTFLNVPKVDSKIYAKNFESRDCVYKRLVIDNVVPSIKVDYDHSKFFILLGSAFMLKEFIMVPLQQIQQRVSRDKRRSMTRKLTSAYGVESEKLSCGGFLESCEISWLLPQADVVIHMTSDYRIRSQLFGLDFKCIDRLVSVKIQLLRLLANSPTNLKPWSRVLVVDTLATKVKLDQSFISSIQEGFLIEIKTRAVRVIQPHQFVVYHLFDNLSTSVKIVKHLVETFTDKRNKNDEHPQVVEPHESKALKVPPIHMTSDQLSFTMEDDPFEGELSMIYQLGLVEQRKRLEQYSLLDSKLDMLNNDEGDNLQSLDSLNKLISRSWIRKVNVYKKMLAKEILNNKDYLYGSETTLDRHINRDVAAYIAHAPLFSLKLENLDVKIQSTSFPLDEIPQYLYDIGQQVPKDTIYSLMLPAYLDVNIGELRMHLRDYPLPLLHVPANADNSPSLSMAGNLIIAENLAKAKEHVREMIVPLISGLGPVKKVKNMNNDARSAQQVENGLGVHRLMIRRSLSTVKLYSDLRFKFSSSHSSRFVWGQSYQFALQQTIMNFDQFSKPPVDPLEKLGTWDKLRLIIHGNFKISVADEGDLQIAIKGSRDPYNLFGLASGFVLAFKDEVEWKVNKDDDPRLLFEILADKVSFFIPNYLAAPLTAWTRHSSKAVYLPDAKAFITSTYGYLLEDTPTMNVATSELDNDVIEKKVFKLSGGVCFNVGFLLQRDCADGKKTYEGKSHYEIELFNPKYTEKGHDSYAGFRSDYLHMAISLTSNKDGCKNSIHLSPGVFKQLFSWWKLFASNMMLPIRRGPLFGELMESKKFSQHLYTNKFLFRFKSVFISHIYRDETVDAEDERIECIGARAKVDEFVLDLHQRKEPRVLVHEGLDRNTDIKKMNFNIGQSHLKGIDLRTIYAIFDQNVYTIANVDNTYTGKRTPDPTWFDIDDYEEVSIPALGQSNRESTIRPLLYTECFSYLRDTSTPGSEKLADDDELGMEDNHDCMLDSQNVFEFLTSLYEDRIAEIETQVKKNSKAGKTVKRLESRIASLKENIKEYSADHYSTMSVHRRGHSYHPANDSHEDQQTQRSLTQNHEDGGAQTMPLGHPDHGEDQSADVIDAKSTSFHNRFMLISMLLKWNNENRNLVLKFIQFIQWKALFSKYLSHEAINTLEDIISLKKDAPHDDVSSITKSLHAAKKDTPQSGHDGEEELTSEERIQVFDKILRAVGTSDKMVREDYLIEIISPQIQMQSEDAPDSVLLVAAPMIEVKIVSIIDLSNYMVDNVRVLEDRYGVLMKDANIFILNKDDVVRSDSFILTKHPYGAEQEWPPWLGIEICKNGSLAGKDNLLVERTSSMVIYEKSKPLGHGDDDETTISDGGNHAKHKSTSVKSRLLVDVPKLVITSTAKQYATLYLIVMSLLFYVEPMNKNLSKKLEKLRFSIDFQDLEGIHLRIMNLHRYYRLLDELAKNYQFRQHTLNNEDLNDYITINLEKGQTALEIYLLMESILSGYITEPHKTSSHPVANWVIGADQIIMHLLQDDRTPILDIAMAKGKCTRAINEDESNSNKIEIYMMQMFNMLKTATYPDLFGPLNHEDTDDLGSIVTVDWTMNRPVGGIKIIDYFELNAQPLNIKIDDITGETLMKYVFQTDTENIKDSPLLTLMNNDDADEDSLNDDIADADDLTRNFINKFEETGDLIEATDGANVSKVPRKDNEGSGIDSDKIGSGAIASNNGSTEAKSGSNSTSGSRNDSRSNDSSQNSSSEYENDVDEMVSRSKQFMSVGKFHINPFAVLISIKCHKSYRKILNVEDFLFKLPSFHIRSAIVSALDITLMVKRTVIKSLLSHTGRLLKNKFKVRKKKSHNLIRHPLAPVKRYVKFTDAADLRSGSVEPV